jgi:2-C-methyl-D-erythritol 2,4-cyclodiphosphate synthase
MMRTGIGYDIHRLVDGRKLILGGVSIPFHKGLFGHSDADVLIHAVCDALLGAAGLGDIGLHFPDSDDRFKDISSMILLEKTFKMISEKGFVIHNIDTVIFAQEPKLSPYRKKMAENIAGKIAIEPDRVNIKATTTEGLGIIGKGDGIAAMCSVLIDT